MNIINHQPVEKSTKSTNIQVHSIFDTIQGEGPYAGMPATFIRLAGCNLQCAFCDTEYTMHRKIYTPERLIVELREGTEFRKLIVITGGEPFRQDIIPFCVRLLSTGHIVQVETNGTLFLDSLQQISTLLTLPNQANFKIVCSPKTPSLHPRMWDWISELKYVVEAGSVDTDGLPIRSVGPQYGVPAKPPAEWSGQVFIQPLDSQDADQNKANMQAAVDSCLTHEYRLCLQIQKIVELP